MVKRTWCPPVITLGARVPVFLLIYFGAKLQGGILYGDVCWGEFGFNFSTFHDNNHDRAYPFRAIHTTILLLSLVLQLSWKTVEYRLIQAGTATGL
jgi:hypothetical protein